MSAAGTNVDNVSLDTIVELDEKIQTIQALENDDTHTAITLLVNGEEVKDEELKAPEKVVHDLAPVHSVLVSLATELQNKVDQAVRELQEVRLRLAREM